MFISRQAEKCALIKFMHYPMQKKHVIYFFYVARLESDSYNQCAYILWAGAAWRAVAATLAGRTAPVA